MKKYGIMYKICESILFLNKDLQCCRVHCTTTNDKITKILLLVKQLEHILILLKMVDTPNIVYYLHNMISILAKIHFAHCSGYRTFYISDHEFSIFIFYLFIN